MKTIKTIILLSLAILINQSDIQAQSYAYKYKGFEPGHFEISAGLGLLPTFTSRYVHTKIPPLNLNIDFRIKQHFSMGLATGFTSTRFYSDQAISKVIPRQIDSDIFLVGLRAIGHYNMDDLDFYGGGMVGYTFSLLDTDIERRALRENPATEDMAKKQMTYSGFMGMKYLITDKMGIYSEFGFGMSLMKFGMTFKL